MKDNSKISGYCEICEHGDRPSLKHSPMAQCCYMCGSKLIARINEPLNDLPLNDLPIAELINTIAKQLSERREEEKSATEQIVKNRNDIFIGEHNYHKHIVGTDGFILIEEIADDITRITVIKDNKEVKDERIAEYTIYTEDAQELWDDLTDILTLQCHPTTKYKYFKQFRVREEPYYSKILSIIAEGGNK